MKKIQSTPKKVEKVVEVTTEYEDEVVATDQTVWDDLLGKQVVIFGAVYIYAGKLIGINGDGIVLQEAVVVYETGSFKESGWKHAETLPCKEWVVLKSAIEGIGAL